MTSDYFPTIMQLLELPLPHPRPYDGISILPIIDGTMTQRPQPIGFRFGSQASMSDNRFKLVHNLTNKRHRSDNGQVPVADYELYDLIDDPSETTNIASQHPEEVQRLKQSLQDWLESCERSDQGGDYPTNQPE